MPYELALDVQALIGGKIYAIDDVERSITKIDEGDEHD
ncbi:Glutathione-regulated potassium-efflux system protein KefB [Leuconostoc inhae]|uniref:Glutathione-regulated potassium-efflux system protein KefB n=2 Tax=Leuconostoc inhae TaxID=178001 RepID=A0ABM9V444_9LACO|nr:Glutathione-regulated potassium-efflux system protein KefB [Leuconostoc inhae]